VGIEPLHRRIDQICDEHPADEDRGREGDVRDVDRDLLDDQPAEHDDGEDPNPRPELPVDG